MESGLDGALGDAGFGGNLRDRQVAPEPERDHDLLIGGQREDGPRQLVPDGQPFVGAVHQGFDFGHERLPRAPPQLFPADVDENTVEPGVEAIQPA